MSAAFELDHVGVGARELAPLAAAYQRLGFTLTPVARHRGKATGNRCIMLQHGYLELIALLDPAIPDRLQQQLGRYAGLHIIALGIADSAATLQRLRQSGLDLPGVAPLERPVDDADPDGLQARFERIPLPDAPEGTIQLIKHLTPEAIWQERFTTHANAAVSLEEVGDRGARPGRNRRPHRPAGWLPVDAGAWWGLHRGNAARPGLRGGGGRGGGHLRWRDRTRLALDCRLHRRHRGWLHVLAPAAGRFAAFGRRGWRVDPARACRRCGPAVHLTPWGWACAATAPI